MLCDLQCPRVYIDLSATRICLQMSPTLVNFYQLQFQTLRVPALAQIEDQHHSPVSIRVQATPGLPVNLVGNEKLKYVQNSICLYFSHTFP
jgi:hypothetical protein